MNDQQLTELIIQIKTSLASIETKVDGIMTTIQNHEHRLQKIESTKVEKSENSSFKDDVIKLLVKAILVSVCGFATLAGAGSVIAKILGN